MVAFLLLLTGKKTGLEKSHERWSYFTMVQPAIVEEKKTVSELRNGKGLVVGHDRTEEFRAAFRGEMIQPGDPGYEMARRIWNASIDKHPGIIARCSGVADVVAAVNFARENDLLVAIRGGGHNVGGKAICDDGIVIDLSGMRGIHVDTKNHTARVQGGATLGEVDRETHLYGLAVPSGVISKTGIAGLTLGGGVGWLVRKYGLTCDNVLSFDIVTADGKPRVASALENEDLFWALRGGGGNFGVVTSFEFRAHPVSTVLGGMILYPRNQAVEVLRFYRDFTQSAPEELTAYAALLHTPDGIPAVAVIACYCGDGTEGEKVFKPLRAFGSPMVDVIQPMPFPLMQSLLDPGFPHGNHNYWKSTFLREFSDDAINLLVQHANRATSPLSGVVIEYYGGAASRVGASETAFAQRQAQYEVGILAQWVDPGESQRHIEWTRGLADSLRPFSSGAYLLNFLGEEGEDTIKAAFGPNYDRLMVIKKKYDPSNFFRLNQNIKPKG
jgi:FAD binding domain/Berberine and berberine like